MKGLPGRLTPWAALTLIVLVALGLRLYRLGQQNFWIDELASLEMARQSPVELIRNYSPVSNLNHPSNQAPIAFTIFTHLFVSRHLDEATARLPAVLLGSTAVLALFLVARLILSRWRTALLAALLLAVSPLHIWYSQETRWYAQSILFTIFSYWMLLKACDTRRIVWWAAYGASTVLNLYTFPFNLFIVVCQGLSTFLLNVRQHYQRRFLREFLVVQFAVIAGAAPLIWLLLNRLDAGAGTPRPSRVADLAYTFFAYSSGYSVGPTLNYLHSLPTLSRVLAEYPVVIIFAAVFLPVILLGIRTALSEWRIAVVLLPWFFAPPFLVWLLSLVTNVTYQVRYGSTALPAFILLTALGVRSLQQLPLRVAATVAILACSAYSLRNYYWDPQYAKEDVRGALAHIRTAGPAGAPVLAVGEFERTLNYYGHGLSIVQVHKCTDDSSVTPLNRALDGVRNVWLVTSRDWDRQGPRCLRRIEETFSVVDHRNFPGAVHLWLLRKRHENTASTDPPL